MATSFLVSGVDQTLTSEEGAGKGWAHAQWVVEPRRQGAPPHLIWTTPTGGQCRFTPVACLNKVKQLQQSGGVKKEPRNSVIFDNQLHIING